MKKIVLLLLLSISVITICLAQKIKVYKTFGGVRFEMDTVTLGLNQLLEIVLENPQAYDELRRAKTNYNTAGVLGFAGGILVGFPVGTAIAGGNPEWGMAAGGAMLLLASIPFSTAFRTHTMESLDLYNNKFKIVRLKPELQFYGTGARLAIRF